MKRRVALFLLLAGVSPAIASLTRHDYRREWRTIAGVPVQYDAAGNLCHDEDGRGYEYDEQNRLTRVFVDANSNCVFDGGETQLAAYTYDALGRKVTATVGAVTTRFYYDGQRVIEERDAGDAVVRYHVNGGQFIDEHIATYDAAAAAWTYYLPNANYSVAGTGDATGTTIERLDYSASGDFAVGPAGTYAHDADADADIDLLDFANLQVCFGTTVPACLDVHDFDVDGQSDGVINIDDFDGFAQCFNGPDLAPLPGCELAPPKFRGTPPETGLFTLHGRPIDVLPDGKVLMDFRTRIYDPRHGRWLQRDGSGYGDGSSLYEAFRTNAARFRDPLGRQSSEDWDMTWEMLRRYFTPEGWMQRAEEKAMGLPPQVPDPVAQAVFQRIEVANDVAAEVARKAEPYVRPARQVLGVGGGAVLVVVGGSAVLAPDPGVLDVPGVIAVGRGTDLVLTNAYGLYTGTLEPTAQWLIVNRLAGPEIASVSELGVDLALLPMTLESLPARGTASTFSSTATFAGSRSLVIASEAGSSGVGLLDRLAGQSQRVIRFVIGEEEGYVLGTGLSPGPVRMPALASVQTPYGPAAQSTSRAAILVRGRIAEGAPVFRVGTLGRSEAADAQFWAIENPLTPGFAERYGIPPGNILRANFIEGGRLRAGTTFVTREAPPVGAHGGGAVEVVVPERSVELEWFVMIGE